MNLQSNRPSEFQDGRKGLGCSDRARQELTFDVAVPWEFSAFFSYFGERNDGWEKNGWMDGGCFLFPEHFRPPTSASPLSPSLGLPHPSRRTDRQKEGLACPARGPRTWGPCTTDEPNERVVYELLNQWSFRMHSGPSPPDRVSSITRSRVRETGNVTCP